MSRAPRRVLEVVQGFITDRDQCDVEHVCSRCLSFPSTRASDAGYRGTSATKEEESELQLEVDGPLSGAAAPAVQSEGSFDKVSNKILLQQTA
jgi:hypothetical protein